MWGGSSDVLSRSQNSSELTPLLAVLPAVTEMLLEYAESGPRVSRCSARGMWLWDPQGPGVGGIAGVAEAWSPWLGFADPQFPQG